MQVSKEGEGEGVMEVPQRRTMSINTDGHVRYEGPPERQNEEKWGQRKKLIYTSYLIFFFFKVTQFWCIVTPNVCEGQMS